MENSLKQLTMEIKRVLSSTGEVLGIFIIGYPMAMSVVWIICGYFFYRRHEKHDSFNVNSVNIWPEVTILIPCHNEEKVISTTCKHIQKLDYPNFQVVFINDASTDQTANVIRSWVKQVQFFHLLNIQDNKGKSAALNNALAVSGNSPITVVMDADTLPNPYSIKHLVNCLMSSENIGAVTAQPVVYNRNGLLEKMQTVEFTSIIGLIKRAQNLYGYLFSISGCLTAFRTNALFEVGGFSSKTATEDIDITWSLQKAFYRIVYCPQAIAYIQVPNRMKDFWKQRSRWALGAWHLIRTHYEVVLKWRWRSLWPIYVDIILSFLWAVLFVLGGAFWLSSQLVLVSWGGFNPLPGFTSLITIICIIQLLVATKLAKLYDPSIRKHLFLIAWYPLFYFSFGAFTVLYTSKKGLFQNMNSAGKWKSTTRMSITSDEKEG